MSTKTKIYKLIDHSFRPSRTVYVCAKSKRQVGEILDKPMSLISDYLSVATNESAHAYLDLSEGEYRYENYQLPFRQKGELGRRELERIAALGFIKSAKLAVTPCDLPTAEMKQKQQQIIALLDELYGDMGEYLDDIYQHKQ